MTGMMHHPLKEKRRANKPLLERKRRARINDSLTDLKHLVLSSLNKDVTKYAKMEKVDILDMTVRYLKGRCVDIQRQPETMSLYRAGYRDSTKDIYQSIMSMDGIDHSIKCRILSDLANNARQQQRRVESSKSLSSSPPPSPTLSEGSTISSPPLSLYNAPPHHHQHSHHYMNASPINNNTHYLVPPSFPGAHSYLPPLIHPSSTVCIASSRMEEEEKEEKVTDVWRPW